MSTRSLATTSTTAVSGRCAHLDTLDPATLKRAYLHVCEECVRSGSRWVHLRTCQTCGVTLCCDSSLNKHARAHAVATGHPVVQSAEPGESWLYCFVDDVYVPEASDLVADVVGARDRA